VVAGVGTYETEPLFLLRTANILPEQFWAGADDR
jgi:hypothetical protein